MTVLCPKNGTRRQKSPQQCYLTDVWTGLDHTNHEMARGPHYSHVVYLLRAKRQKQNTDKLIRAAFKHR